MHKSVMSFLLALVVIVVPITASAEATRVEFNGNQPVVIDGRTLVPVRGVFEVMDFEISWDSDTQQVSLSRDGDIVTITIGSAVFIHNNTSHTLDVPAQVIAGSTMLPLRTVLESVGYSINWDEGASLITIEMETSSFALHVPAHPSLLQSLDILRTPELSIGQQNIVRRAHQMTDIEWSPVGRIQSWRDHPNFQPGNTYRGIPYGRPNLYTPLDFSFEHFINAVNDPNSRMYTRNATRDSLAPFYSTDCSAFVSYAWGISRHWTWQLPNISDNIGRRLQDIEVGDALNNPTVHVVLVTGIERDESGNIIAMEISEAFLQTSRRRWFGAGHALPLSRINTDYLNRGFNILRFRDRDNVIYEHSCLVPIIRCENCVP